MVETRPFFTKGITANLTATRYTANLIPSRLHTTQPIGFLSALVTALCLIRVCLLPSPPIFPGFIGISRAPLCYLLQPLFFVGAVLEALSPLVTRISTWVRTVT